MRAIIRPLRWRQLAGLVMLIVMDGTQMLRVIIWLGLVSGFEWLGWTSITGGAPTVEWTGDGAARLLVQVPPVDLAGRQSDEMVAAIDIDFVALLRTRGRSGQVDLSTLQVHAYEVATGRAEAFKPFDSSRSDYDRPCRFDDDTLPTDYPARVGRASEQPSGRPRVTLRRRKARLFNREQDNTSGRVVWVHTQRSGRPSHYAIYFDVPPDGPSRGMSPAPWIGDVDVLRREKGQSLAGLSHFTATVGDYNGDGLFDLLAGTEKGDLMWFPNRGEEGTPKFLGCHMLTDEEGPIDVGWYGAPYLYDWDADGATDLLVGTSGNVILWWKNVGTSGAPELRYRGFVEADGGRLAVPQSPVPEDTNQIFKRDYYNQPWVGDWSGDGVPDILTGGYTTGRIFFYRSTGRDGRGVPTLQYAGHLEADGKPIDTTWAAAPLAFDFDADGQLELITGSWWWSGIPRPPAPGEVEYLMYYRNPAAPGTPGRGYERAPLPRVGAFPSGSIARPSAVDWNADGLVDLVVSDAGGHLYVFLNVGRASQPRWKVDRVPLSVPWGFVGEYGLASSSADLDADGHLETISGATLKRISGSLYSPRIESCGRALVGGQPIRHAGPGYGDPYSFSVLFDWDGDGRADVLWATHQGNVFLHRHLGRPGSFAFAPGVELRLTTGDALRVGPQPVSSPEDATDFTILQGARAKLTVGDFDADGIADLAVTETYGNVWVFRNTRTGGTDTLEPGVRVHKLASRTAALNTIDWNQDGKPDLITGGTAARPGLILPNRSTPGKLEFGEPLHSPTLPYVFWGPRLRGSDWNRDGDEDLLIQSEFYSFWAERSFLDHGYRLASAVGELEWRR